MTALVYGDWDGMSKNGNEAVDGIYFYKYVAQGIVEGSEIEGHGFLHLFRGEE